MPFKPPPDLSRFLLSPMPGLLVEVAVEAGPGGARRRAAGRDRGDEDGEHPASPRTTASSPSRRDARARASRSTRSSSSSQKRGRSASERDRSERPFRVLGVQQIAVGGADKAALRTLWVDCLGLEVDRRHFRSERENVDEDICAVGSGLARGRGRPDAADRSRRASRRSTRRRSTTSACGSTTCAAAVAWLDGAAACASRPAASARARRATTSASSIPRPNDEFPIAGEGVLIELVQAPPEVIAAWQASHDSAMTVRDDPEDGRPAPAAHRAAGRRVRHAGAARARRRHVRDDAMRSTAPAWRRRRSASTCSS